MKLFFLSCSLFLLLGNAVAQNREFTYDPFLKVIHTNNEVSGYVQEIYDRHVNQLTTAPGEFIFMDDQLRTIARKELEAKPLYMRVLSTARLGNMLAVMYSMDDTGIMTDVISISANATVQQYREVPPKRNYPFYHDDQVVIAIPGVGFACYYGQKYGSKIQLLDTAGQATGSAIFPYKTDELRMISEGRQLHFLTDDMVTHYDLDQQIFLAETKLPDGMETFRFDVDPVTGKPYVSGVILHPKRKFKAYEKGRYTGLFSMEMNGKITYTSWGMDSVVPVAPEIGVRNLRGNTVFAGGRVENGEFADPFFMEVDSSGRIVEQYSFPTSHHRARTMNPSLRNGHQSFWKVTTEKGVYLVVKDMENTFILNLDTRQVVLKEKLWFLMLVPVKKGYVMVREADDKTHVIRYSIRDFEELIGAAKQ